MFVVMGILPLVSVPAYLGPESMMPLATAIAAILGFLLMFWRVILRGIKRILGIKTESPVVEPEEDEPVAAMTIESSENKPSSER